MVVRGRDTALTIYIYVPQLSSNEFQWCNAGTRCVTVCCAIKYGIQEDGADREARVASFWYRYQASLSFTLRQKWLQESVSGSLPDRRHSQS